MESNWLEADGGFSQAPLIVLPTHNLTRYLRIRVEVTDGLLQWDVPRTLLGIVPLGVRHVEVPIQDVRSVKVDRTVRPVGAFLGVVGVLSPLVISPWWMAIPVVLAGLWVCLVSLGPQIEVTTIGGRKHTAAVCFGHQFDAEIYADTVNDLASRAR